MDFARRPTNQQPLLPHTAPTLNITNNSSQQLATSGSPHTQQLQPQQQQLQQQQAQKRAQYKEGPKFGLKSMVSMDDMPELFASFDSKLTSKWFAIAVITYCFLYISFSPLLLLHMSFPVTETAWVYKPTVSPHSLGTVTLCAGSLESCQIIAALKLSYYSSVSKSYQHV